MVGSVPIEGRYTVFKLFLKKFEEELGVSMTESIFDPLKEMVAVREREKGREESRQEGLQEVALKMKQKGSTVEFIHEVTGLPAEEIGEL